LIAVFELYNWLITIFNILILLCIIIRCAIANIVLLQYTDQGNKEGIRMVDEKTTIQVTPRTRDRLYKLKFRRTYDQFLNELCEMYERENEGG